MFEFLETIFELKETFKKWKDFGNTNSGTWAEQHDCYLILMTDAVSSLKVPIWAFTVKLSTTHIG